MSVLIDRAIGLYHFLFDRVPSGLPVVEPRRRAKNPWLKDGLPVLAKVRDGGDVREAVIGVIGLLGSLGAVIKPGDAVLVKPNFNSPDPPPASTDLVFLKAVVELLLDSGARVTIGECSGGLWRPTRRVFHRLGVYQLAQQLGVKLVAFEDNPGGWLRVRIDGDHIRAVTVPRLAYEADHLIYVPCLKTHKMAGFTGALKLAFGFVHPGERRYFHVKDLQAKVAEVSLCWQPTLVVMDGRKAFITGGPDRGRIAEPGIIMASGDPVAVDVEAVKVLVSSGASGGKLRGDPWQNQQIATAIRHGLGCPGMKYALVEDTVRRQSSPVTLFGEFLSSGDTLRVYYGGELIFSSKKDRLQPLLDYIGCRSPLPAGVVVFDRVTGNAAALLLQKIGCCEVYSSVGSRLAAETLEKFGIRYHFSTMVDFIADSTGKEMCPMEKLSIGKGPDDFFATVTSLLTITRTQRSKN